MRWDIRFWETSSTAHPKPMSSRAPRFMRIHYRSIIRQQVNGLPLPRLIPLIFKKR